jgi:hypothetical protein
MSRNLVDQIARAVLYEGYILYPYRPCVKNHQRWTFGGLYPPSYSESQSGSDASSLQAQCLLTADQSSTLNVSIRFLHLIDSTVEQAEHAEGAVRFRPVANLEVAGRSFQSWQEAMERRIDLGGVRDTFGDPVLPLPVRRGRVGEGACELLVGKGIQSQNQPPSYPPPAYREREKRWPPNLSHTHLGEITLPRLLSAPLHHRFAFPSASTTESLEESGRVAGRLVRHQQQIDGAIDISADEKSPGVFALTVRVENQSGIPHSKSEDRDAALMQSLVSTHLVLGIRHGQFVSATDPPPQLQSLAASCQNIGCWPVLVGEPGQADALLVSPIILYDYPQIAPESEGDFFDGTEMDEMLALRVLTLTDAEKEEMRSSDPRARRILERTESLTNESMLKAHGVIRSLREIRGSQPVSPDPLGAWNPL